MDAANSLRISPPSRADVTAFVQKQLDDSEKIGDICSFDFFDAAKDGTYRLLASIDYSGRHFCNTVVAIGKRISGFQIHELAAWQVDEVSDIIRDLDHDGGIELAIPQPLSDYEGGQHCMATWTRLYRWRNGHFEDASASFRQFYENRLRQLIAAAPSVAPGPRESASPARRDEEESGCALMEADKIRRFLGMSARAGFAQAVAWMGSADTSLRRKAIRVFDDIGDKDSLAKLGVLARDTDPSVAQAARGALQRGARQ